MKRIILNIFFAWLSIVTPCMAADTYIPLDALLIDNESDDESEHPTRSMKQLHADGVRTVNQVLDCSKRHLTTLIDFAQYGKNFDSTNIVTMNISGNYIGNNDLCTILKYAIKLTFLDASHNKKITTIEHIPPHDALETLLLHNNRIKTCNIGHVCTQLSKLRQLTLQGNQLQPEAITNITVTHAQMEECWLGDLELSSAQTDAFIKTFPNIKAELVAGSRAVQKYYSKTEQQYDNCNECDADGECCMSYGCSPLIGGVAGLAAAGIAIAITQTPVPNNNHFYPDFTDDPYYPAKKHNAELFGIYCAIMVPIGVLLPPLVYRLGKTIHNYCITPPHLRYATHPTRKIEPLPVVLALTQNEVEPNPGQEE